MSSAGSNTRNRRQWSLLALTSFIGFFGIRFSLRALHEIWLNDPLQSIGVLLLPISIFLILREFRRRNWELRGSWVGLLLICLAFTLSLSHEDFALTFSAAGILPVSMTPFALPVFLYVSGLVVLFAGWRLFRQALLPLLLLLMLKPVPRVFSVFFDLPLQHLTAEVARSFATAIGFRPRTPELLLMFSPDFGMFIAPGCDGIRGASTMGYLALILGYLKRLRTWVWVAYVIGFTLLGYAFNLVRICLLVLYYRVALGHPSWENFAKQADYIIGICLFGVAAMVLSDLVLRRRTGPSVVVHDPVQGKLNPATGWKCLALLSLLLVTSGFYAFATRHEASPDAAKPAGERMPQQVGSFRLVNTWYESDMGSLRNEVAIYESTETHHQVKLILWLPHTLHNLHDSWYARGLTADRRGIQTMMTVKGPVAFDVGHYRDGENYALLLNATCTPAACSALTESTGFLPLVFNRPDFAALAKGGGRMIPFGLVIQRPTQSTPANEEGPAMDADAKQFLQGLDPEALSKNFQ